MRVSREDLRRALDRELNSAQFNDYCPNGLQVEGAEVIRHVVSGVTACQALLDAAVEAGADALIVHHGYFWRGEDQCITGMKGRRIRTLLRANMNLFAYHLPLDCHPTLGNNAGLGRVLGVGSWASLNPNNVSYPVFSGDLPGAESLESIGTRLSEKLGRTVTVEGDASASIRSVAWCTGGGQSYIDDAADAGADLFVTGEVSEQTIHVARERGIAFIAAGHHATERFGASSLGDWLASEFDVTHQFIDIENPA